MSIPVFYSQMSHLSISSAAFCRYLHISFLVLYISEKVPVAYYFAYKSGVIALVPLSFLVLLYRMINASYPKHHTPNSALRALCFPPTGPPFSHWPKRIHSSSSRFIESRPIRTPCCTFFYPALPHVALLSSSLCKKMPPPIGKHLPKRCKNNARHKNKAQAVSACALSHTISPLAAPMVCRWGHSSSFNQSWLMAMTTPEPTVRPPSRIAKRRPVSIAMGVISSTFMSTLSPGMHISVPSGREMMPVTSVVRK